MPVPMVAVRRVGMHVTDWRVNVPVTVGFAGRIVWLVKMPMVVVVDMAVVMFSRLVNMVVSVLLGQVQPHSERHQSTRHDQLQRQRFAVQQDGRRGPDKRGG